MDLEQYKKAREHKLRIESEGETIYAFFNPNKLVIAKSVSWQPQQTKEHDVPELQFTSAQSRTLTLELFFDTYDSESESKENVRKYTNQLLKLALINSEKHRPPVCNLFWGENFFKGVLEKLDQQFTLFLKNGTPVRSICNCIFKEWRKSSQDGRDRQSSDIAKKRVVKRGETLSSIASEVYENAQLWRPIAEKNEIDDPMDLKPGTELLIPILKR